MDNSETDGESQDTRLTLVAIGASAGGLEPLEDFFKAAPADAGWCFVVIQHLSPDYRSMMHELLARQTRLEIRHIEDGSRLRANTVYLNQPNTNAELDGDVFRVRSNVDDRPLPHLPIDGLFRTLASRGVDRTFAVILSGSGSDGSRGAQEFHKLGGTVLVQSPQEAGFSSMPRAALTAGVVDRVLGAAEMPQAIRLHIDSGVYTDARQEAEDSRAESAILGLLERQHHVDFSAYKAANVLRRIERRQKLRGIATLSSYLEFVQDNASALDELYQDLLIGVTQFYRDPDAITVLRKKALEEMVANSTEESSLRIWVPACASGEEAYTIAIELSEALAAAGVERRFRIIATDVHRGSLDMASSGIFPESALEGVSQDIRDRYFTRHRDRYVVDPVLRQKIVFSVHDLLSDPPFMQLDLISCRNLLIYLNEEAQLRVISMFLFGLRKAGFLLLGPSESLGRYADEFEVINGRWRLFRNTSDRRVLDRSVLANSVNLTSRSELVPNLSSRLQRKPGMSRQPAIAATVRDRDTLVSSYDALLKRYAPSSILLAADGAVLAWFGQAGTYVDTMNNLAEWTVEDIVHPDLHFPINVAMERFRHGLREAYVRSVMLELPSGEKHQLAVTIEPLDMSPRPRFLLIGLKREDLGETEPAAPQDSAPPPGNTAGGPTREDHIFLSRRIQELERDLRLTEETLQNVTERLEASGEELQASNEELQASNEELQASNEELQSSNEELHAVNEELVSVSSEHERQIEMLSELNRDTEVVLRLLKTGVIVLDSQLRIRRFSQLIGRVFQMEAHDVQRSLDVVSPRLDFADLAGMARQVIETGEPVVRSGTYGGHDLEVRAHPFDRIEDDGRTRGVAVLFTGAGVFS
ncbi:CheR family methyltransferase [Pseudooceanicola algae]|uniref:Protein-glutamate methylesterase/protein-glutamine glutaminase n=1 Tax=Pseudooceanicola algae TaxID=1537215 RepID=A0A418SIQ2_9RHOB|nr:CheR family methyltransferase [Pseudooceanicola algae]QPM91199.1 Protein-glutamate methylesterase/protein-glutamine glutaminase [Pseudooceanicola algae]